MRNLVRYTIKHKQFTTFLKTDTGMLIRKSDKDLFS